ncbi:uncharacterized protein MKZ38_003838 [Zalerion maritima]|uniref:Deoxycytidylate deaminase n=1 Tax=Zalerion maritima TaxID=339359 RepID=A0AAD5RMZ1_9PEZI|nr:uncharacterized protein MKZ38_003838 [Zalerion maritima]
MLIGICGALCAGKNTIANYLAEHHGFQRIYLVESASEGGDPALNSTTHPPSTKGSSSTLCPITFTSSDDLLNFVTKHWRTRYVTTHIDSPSLLDQLSRRPFFLLISVDAPILRRYSRHVARCRGQRNPESGEELMNFEAFAQQSDEHLYSPSTGLFSLSARADIVLLNTSTSVAHLYATLGRLSLQDEGRLRPSWDMYFMSLASLAAKRSNCMKRRVGCVLVRDKRVVATGYNGTPRGLTNCMEGGCGRCNGTNASGEQEAGGQGSGVGLATCLCLHAEENALLEAGRGRISGGLGIDGGGEEGSILYCDTCPCLTCSIKIAQVGIKEVVYAHGYSMDEQTARVLGEAGVKLRQFVPPANGLIHLENLDLN